MKKWLHITLFGLMLSASATAEKVATCGVASGFPPYQFEMNGKAVGIDVDVMQGVFNEAQLKSVLVQTKWDDIVSMLRFDKINCVGLMEITEERKKIFDFTDPIYQRKTAVFILSGNSKIDDLDDLLQQRVAGDRQSFVERHFEKRKMLHKMRVVHTPTKEQSMRMLRDNEVDAVIAPVEVGHYFARKWGISVKLLGDPDAGSPVGIAVKKGNAKLLRILNRGLEQFQKKDGLNLVHKKWRIP